MAATALRTPALRLQPTTVPPGPAAPEPPPAARAGGRPGAVPAGPAGRLPAAPARGWRWSVAVVVAVRPPGHRCRGQVRRRCPLRRRRPLAHLGRRLERGRGGCAATVVVQPGDTLWSIAADVAPDADVRITVDQLIALNGAQPDRRRPGARRSRAEPRGRAGSVRRCAVPAVVPSTTRSSTRARPTTARRSGAGARASTAAAGSPPSSASRRRRSSS